ncbi:MAG: EAL domain-containing protein [Alphaproteobacteria bacterium]|nr:EAL domain-containing protein [Alphaproteobacteria bacterium]
MQFKRQYIANEARSVSLRGLAIANQSALAFGCAWAVLPALFFAGADETGQLVLTCIVAGMMGAGAFTLASVPMAAKIFCSLILAGSAIGIFREHFKAGFYISLLMTAYFVVLMRAVWIYYSHLKKHVLENYEAEQLVRVDTLTRLPNRIGFHEDARHALERYARTGESFTIMYLDLDGFKLVNDRYGHRAGDQLLIEFGRRLEKAVRGVDCVARMSGDEFAAVAANVNTPAEAAAVADRILVECRKPIFVDDVELKAAVSIGIVIVTPDALDVETLIRRADAALYRAKQTNRGGFCFFSPSQDVSANERKALKDAMVLALGDHQFALNFQPLLDLQTNRIAAFEALVRWNHPSRGMISPENFIPVAEESGMIHAIGNWVLQEACHTAASWPDDVRIAINVSAVQFRDPMLVEAVRGALTTSGLAAGRLEIELTETAFLNECPATHANIAGLRAMGIKLLLDDFGTGYASLGILQNVKCDALKIDRSFISKAGRDEVSTVIVASLVKMAQALGIKVIAEGVESETQLFVLRNLGCDYAQGYYISRPADRSVCEGLLARHNSATSVAMTG